MIYDILIVGGGPAGLTAAVYARRANKSVMVLEKNTFGGQITSSPKVENIPGFVSLSGNEFADKLLDQAMSQGAEVDCAEVLSIQDGDIKKVRTDSGDYEAKAVIIATGATHRLLGLDKESDFIGNGISFCAVCDGAFYKDKTVAVIGGGNSALQETILLAEQCKKVIVVQNLDFLTGEQKLRDQIAEKDNVEVILGAIVKELKGDDELKGIVIEFPATAKTQELVLDGMFVAIGLVPQNENFANVLKLDERGYADTDESLITPTKGIFVAGDCRKKRIRQVATAASDGAIAALAACDYLDR